MAPSNLSAQITEAHEDRLQRLEGKMETVLVGQATTDVKLDTLVSKIDSGFSSISERLDKGEARFDKHDEDIKLLKDAESSRATRWNFVKKAVLPLMAGAAGVIMTHFADSIWVWLSQLF